MHSYFSYESGNTVVNNYCQEGSETYFVDTLQSGSYVARVRAITPAGNASWSEGVSFVIAEPKAEKDLTLVLGVSIGSAILIIILLIFIVYCALCKK